MWDWLPDLSQMRPVKACCGLAQLQWQVSQVV
jgi:hypothetical protein